MKELCLIIWMLLTIVLAFSIVGLLLFIPIDINENYPNVPSTWMQIGKKLLENVVNK